MAPPSGVTGVGQGRAAVVGRARAAVSPRADRNVDGGGRVVGVEFERPRIERGALLSLVDAKLGEQGDERWWQLRASAMARALAAVSRKSCQRPSITVADVGGLRHGERDRPPRRWPLD